MEEKIVEKELEGTKAKGEGDKRVKRTNLVGRKNVTEIRQSEKEEKQQKEKVKERKEPHKLKYE